MDLSDFSEKLGAYRCFYYNQCADYVCSVDVLSTERRKIETMHDASARQQIPTGPRSLRAELPQRMNRIETIEGLYMNIVCFYAR